MSACDATAARQRRRQRPTLTKADFQSDQETRWCPGCGDYAVLSAVQQFMPELGIPPERIVFITGIGCAGRFAYYMDTYGMHGIHGRAPALATGLATAREDLSIWVVTGDGDSLSIGGNHLIHALRRNVPVKILLFNNQIYGLTKGQASPTSELGKITKSTPFGVADHPFNPVALALGAEATFVARTIDRDRRHLTEVLRAAAQHEGAALVEIYQNCPVFNDGAFVALTEKDVKDAEPDPARGGPADPIRRRRRARRRPRRRRRPEIVDVAEVGEDALLVHDPHRMDPGLGVLAGQAGRGPDRSDADRDLPRRRSVPSTGARHSREPVRKAARRAARGGEPGRRLTGRALTWRRAACEAAGGGGSIERGPSARIDPVGPRARPTQSVFGSRGQPTRPSACRTSFKHADSSDAARRKEPSSASMPDAACPRAQNR